MKLFSPRGCHARRDGVGVTDPVLSDGVGTMVPGVSERTNGATKFSHLDRLGTNAKTTDAGGTVVDSRRYDAFGLPISVTNPTNSQKGFASAFGYQEDSETGLKLLGHRYYDPGCGRFITRDPARQGQNYYVYCDNNPLGSVDPDGLKRLVIVGSIHKDEPGMVDTVDRELARRYTRAGDIVLYEPTEAEMEAALARDDVDEVAIIGHGGKRGVRTKGDANGTTTDYFSPELVAKARHGRKLKRLFLEACSQLCSSPKGTGMDQVWGRLADEIWGYDETTDTLGRLLGFDPPWGGSGHPKRWIPANGPGGFRAPVGKKGKKW